MRLSVFDQNGEKVIEADTTRVGESESVSLIREQQSRIQEQRALEEQLADERARNAEMVARLGREQEQRAQSQELARQLERELEESPTRPAPSAIVSPALWPGVSRSGGARPELALKPTTKRGRLQIGIEPEDRYSRFAVELRAPGGGAGLDRKESARAAGTRRASRHFEFARERPQGGRARARAQRRDR